MKKGTLILGIYLGGVAGVWLMQTWIGFDEFPFREIGAILWPILPLALKIKGNE